VNVSPDLE